MMEYCLKERLIVNYSKVADVKAMVTRPMAWLKVTDSIEI